MRSPVCLSPCRSVASLDSAVKTLDETYDKGQEFMAKVVYDGWSEELLASITDHENGHPQVWLHAYVLCQAMYYISGSG